MEGGLTPHEIAQAATRAFREAAGWFLGDQLLASLNSLLVAKGLPRVVPKSDNGKPVGYEVEGEGR